MSENVVKLTNIGKSFTSSELTVKVLENIDFTLDRKEFVAIEGPSGGGKSTLLSIIGLLDSPTSGEYKLCDQSILTLSAYQLSLLRNQNIGWIFQNFNLIGDMTVSENLLLPLRYNRKINRGEYSHSVSSVLEKVDLTDKKNQYPAQLSGGEQQRVAIARALITNPDLLLADEPTGNLDSQNTNVIIDLLHQLHKDGASIILVTHDASLADHAEKKYYLKDGQFINR